ncbi:MAG: hypothetical protein IT308_02735 [Anaerolineaceae bacterium]|nr:hypothetical protein [Anaerolineaceae bacterium]
MPGRRKSPKMAHAEGGSPTRQVHALLDGFSALASITAAPSLVRRIHP